MIKVPEMIKHGIWYLTVRFEEFCQHPSQFFEVKNPKNGVQEFWMVLCVLPFQHAICFSSSQFNIYASVHKKSIQKIRCIGFNNSTTNACNNQVLDFSIDETLVSSYLVHWLFIILLIFQFALKTTVCISCIMCSRIVQQFFISPCNKFLSAVFLGEILAFL